MTDGVPADTVWRTVLVVSLALFVPTNQICNIIDIEYRTEATGENALSHYPLEEYATPFKREFVKRVPEVHAEWRSSMRPSVSDGSNSCAS